MIESNTIVAAAAKTITFNNRLPLRTSQDIKEVWLGYAYLDFGGRYFRFCACVREPGKYHCWTEFNPAYDTDRSQTTYLGLFGSYDELLPVIADMSFDDQGKIIEHLGTPYEDGPAEIEIPEC